MKNFGAQASGGQKSQTKLKIAEIENRRKFVQKQQNMNKDFSWKYQYEII